MSDRAKPEPKRRRVSREYENFMEDISSDLTLPSGADGPSASEVEGGDDAEILGDDAKVVRIWPELSDRIIEEIR